MRLSLDKTWEECLLMWKWLSKKPIDDLWHTDDLKKTYTDVKGYNLVQDCFFCEYAYRHPTKISGMCPFLSCANCPGKKVDKNFNCLKYPEYYEHAIEFYALLVKLNKIRKVKRNGKK